MGLLTCEDRLRLCQQSLKDSNFSLEVSTLMIREGLSEEAAKQKILAKREREAEENWRRFNEHYSKRVFPFILASICSGALIIISLSFSFIAGQFWPNVMLSNSVFFYTFFFYFFGLSLVFAGSAVLAVANAINSSS